MTRRVSSAAEVRRGGGGLTNHTHVEKNFIAEESDVHIYVRMKIMVLF